ncbi:MAG TPA: Wzz/FepE/Etk N-terminal domain-containing protein [Candidatus Nitrosocosmicus sp.]|nr:Wzz/FepE/Etk N-terminal domain-containing protein [Candidatus Nitrosocosmicus sp.]
MDEINFKEILLVLRKRLWIIVLITFLCTGVCGLISYYVLEPEYQTYTTLMIGRPQEYKQGINYDDVMLNQKLVSTYGEIAKSRVVANELMVNLSLSLTYEELQKKINVTLIPETEIIKISVKDKSAIAAARIANEISTVFMKHVAAIMKIDNVQVIDIADVPLEPDKPRPIINMVIASFLGLVLSIFSVLIGEYFDNTVKTQEDIEKYFMLPVLGVIPKAL